LKLLRSPRQLPGRPSGPANSTATACGRQSSRPTA